LFFDIRRNIDCRYRFVICLTASKKMSGVYIKLGQESFGPSSFIPSSDVPWSQILTASLNKPEIKCIYVRKAFAKFWTFRDSNPGRCKRFIFSQKYQHRLWDPSSLLFNGYPGSFPVVTLPGRGTHVHLVPRLRMNGAVPPLPVCVCLCS
jgi:hypothetical protein